MITPKEIGVREAYDRWAERAQSGAAHGQVLRFWESYVALRDEAGVCGHEDPFGGPCLLPKGHQPPRTHDDGRSRS